MSEQTGLPAEERGDTRSIALLSGKGGSGKTIVASVMARVLSESGGRVLLIDADAGTGGLSYFLAIKEVANISKGLVELVKSSSDDLLESPPEERTELSESDTDVFEEGSPSSQAIGKPFRKMKSFSRAWFLPIGDYRDVYRIWHKTDFPDGVKRVIRDLCNRRHWDWIIVDCRGGSDLHSQGVCKVVDDIMLVAEPDTTSYQATQHLVDELSVFDLSDKLCGFIVNKQFDDPLQVSLSGSASFRCRYLGSVPFDFRATRSFMVGDVPKVSSPFGAHVWSALHKLYPNAVKPPTGRVWSRQDFQEIGISNLDSVRGGHVLSCLFLVTLVIYLFLLYLGIEIHIDYVVSSMIALGAGCIGSFDLTRRALGRVVRAYWDFIRRLGGDLE